MAVNKTGATVLILLAGTLPLALSGCKCVRTVYAASDPSPVSVHKMGGDIDVASAPNGAELNTMGGSIHLGNVGSFAKVKTMGGNIAIDHANGSVDAVTMGGRITISSENGSIKASTMAGDITAHVRGGKSDRSDIKLSSLAGTIVLTVPKDFPMEVQITLAYTKNAGDHFRIINHIGLSQQETQEWDNSHGSPRKYIRASGHVGDGRNHIAIDTINGDVILKQE